MGLCVGKGVALLKPTLPGQVALAGMWHSETFFDRAGKPHQIPCSWTLRTVSPVSFYSLWITQAVEFNDYNRKWTKIIRGFISSFIKSYVLWKLGKTHALDSGFFLFPFLQVLPLLAWPPSWADTSPTSHRSLHSESVLLQAPKHIAPWLLKLTSASQQSPVWIWAFLGTRLSGSLWKFLAIFPNLRYSHILLMMCVFLHLGGISGYEFFTHCSHPNVPILLC